MMKLIMVHRPTLSAEQQAVVNRFKELTQCDVVPADKANVQQFNVSNYYDFIVAYGGDGTFATAARMSVRTGRTPVIGVQAGNLNFLNTFGRDFLENSFFFGVSNKDFKEKFKISHRYTGSIGYGKSFANDVVVKAPGTSDEFMIYDVRARYVTSFRGDGVVISTAMGSTAYNLSLGGPILHPTAKMFVITPIAPMTLGSRPLVVCMDKLVIKTGSTANVFVDGIRDTDTNNVFVSPGDAIAVVLPKDYSFYDQLREKLNWHK